MYCFILARLHAYSLLEYWSSLSRALSLLLLNHYAKSLIVVVAWYHEPLLHAVQEIDVLIDTFHVFETRFKHLSGTNNTSMSRDKLESNTSRDGMIGVKSLSSNHMSDCSVQLSARCTSLALDALVEHAKEGVFLGLAGLVEFDAERDGLAEVAESLCVDAVAAAGDVADAELNVPGLTGSGAGDCHLELGLEYLRLLGMTCCDVMVRLRKRRAYSNERKR